MKSALAGAALFSAVAPAASAQDMTEGARAAALWTFGAGRSGFRDAPVAGFVAVTYHHEPVAGPVRPSAGVLASGDGSGFLFGGLSCDLELPRGVGVMPILTAGYYEQGRGMDLGGAFEFRSGLEIYHRFANFSRLGVSIHHISNAGFYDRNPGQETLFLSYGVAR